MESNDIIYDLATEFFELKNYNYELVLGTKDGKPKISFIVDLISLSQRFTHITGLEHIDDINDFNMSDLSANQKDKKRNQALRNVLSNNITFKTIKNMSGKFFNNSTGEYFTFEKTHNPTTGKPYTIIERLNSQKNIESVFNSLYKGKVLQRNPIDNIMGYSKISASYVLKFPTSNHLENLYIFFEKSNSHKKGHDKKSFMRINTAFTDKTDLIKNPINTYTVLKINKIRVSKQSPDEVETIFENQKFVEYMKAKSQNNTSIKTEFIKMDFVKKELSTSGNVAVLSKPRFSFGQALANLINGWSEKIKAGVEERRQELRNAKQEITDLKEAIAKRDEQLAEKNNEIANLKEERAKLTDQLEKQKQLVTTTAKSRQGALHKILTISLKEFVPKTPQSHNLNQIIRTQRIKNGDTYSTFFSFRSCEKRLTSGNK